MRTVQKPFGAFERASHSPVRATVAATAMANAATAESSHHEFVRRTHNKNLSSGGEHEINDSSMGGGSGI